MHSAFAVFGTLMHIQMCNGDDRAPTVTVKAKARAFELACNSANVTFSRASDAAVAQQALNGKSLLRADALKVTLISGGGRREDYDPEHDSDDMDDDYADTYEVDSYDDMEDDFY